MPSTHKTTAEPGSQAAGLDAQAKRRGAGAPLASVIIPTYQDWARCLECLEALQNQTFEANDFEIIIVNNDPLDPCPDPEQLPNNVIVIDEEAAGSYAARNAGVAVSSGAVLAFTDSDCRPAPNWLKASIDAIEANSGIVRVTGPIHIYRPDGCGELAYLYDRKFAFNQSSSKRFEHAVTANLVVPRAVFDRVGLFNARMLSGGDYEWDGRATKVGVPLIFDEKAVVYHPSRRSVAELSVKARRVAGGSVALDHAGIWQMIWSRLKPPVNKLRALDRRDMTYLEICKLFILVWWLRIVAAREYLALHFKLKSPERI